MGVREEDRVKGSPPGGGRGAPVSGGVRERLEELFSGQRRSGEEFLGRASRSHGGRGGALDQGGDSKGGRE